MSQREWKTEGEIKAIVQQESKDWREEVRDNNAEVRETSHRIERAMDKLADGVQVGVNSARIMHGDPTNGIKGALPDIQDRLHSLEDRMEETEKSGTQHHEQNTARLEALEEGQHMIRRHIIKLWQAVAHDKDGKVDYTRLGIVIGSIGTAGHFVLNHLPSWFEVKKFVVQVMTQAGK